MRILNIKHPIGRRGLLCLQQANRYVVHRNASRGFSRQRSVMGVAVHNQVGAVHSSYVPRTLWEDLLSRFAEEIRSPNANAKFRGSFNLLEFAGEPRK